MSLPISIWTTGAPVPEAARKRGLFFEMISAGLSAGWSGEMVDLNCEDPDVFFPAPGEVSGLVISGSPARIGDQEPWMQRTQAELRRFADAGVPILGICFGHQLLGRALGGRTGPNPQGREIGTPLYEPIAEDAYFDQAIASLEGPASLHVVMTHLDSVLEAPAGAVTLGRTQLEKNAALRFRDRVWGVQFHPEMDAELIGCYLRARRNDIEAEGLNVDELLADRREAPFGAALLREFGQICEQSQVAKS
ncbi:MAG: gamma-glutamyl-gamma-aminobutyrate hydrolase family protein [Polyangiaceae bacterium]|nr:gamma-glutamyl-gamma-aminobutyrate hydrolase family protein [Polyangiaceae bacterium]